MTVPQRQIRALYSPETVTVYQAYSHEIAEPALAAGRFVPPFKPDRMTWIKPSFLWTMYRCGWAEKAGQERVLAIELTRSGFEWALARACLSAYDARFHADRAAWARQLKSSPTRVQWDPERSLQLAPLPHRSLQLGLSGEAVELYVREWTVAITDVTALAHTIHAGTGRRRAGRVGAASRRAAVPAARPHRYGHQRFSRVSAAVGPDRARPSTEAGPCGCRLRVRRRECITVLEANVASSAQPAGVGAPNQLNRRARSQLSMLVLQFLLGMGVNLIGLPSENTGATKVITGILLGLHILLSLGLLVVAALCLLRSGPLDDAMRNQALIGAVLVAVSFVAGILDTSLGSNWWSFLMAVAFIGAFVVYGRIYISTARS
jgi:hypothetical protein